MTPGERSRLVKILAQTASAHDSEALTAIRKANEIMRRHQLTWQRLVDGGTTRNLSARPQRAGLADQQPPWSPSPEPAGGRRGVDRAPSHQRIPSHSQILARRLRSFLRSIWRPVRILLGPLTVGAYATAWALEADDWGDVLGRGFVGTAGFLAAALTYFEIGLAVSGQA
jgi:hypothetical protein